MVFVARTIQYNTIHYRMAKIHCHINQWDASVQYFAILHAVKDIHNNKNTLTLFFIVKNKHRSTMRHCLQQKTFVARHMTIVARQNHYEQ